MGSGGLRGGPRRGALARLSSVCARPAVGRGDRERGTARRRRTRRTNRRDSSAHPDAIARKARRKTQDQAQRQDYLALNRFEKLLTLAQSMNLARPVEDDDEEGARHAAENSDEIVSRRIERPPRPA